ncbi:hypothetical protein BDK51DRAFT_41225 [Blyttiomyces helicus]|uniref:Uncharacterized protein n=1 Tax=Blyttiomyces helicus TaxID=388810 RepID=A0A4P9WRI9_9FUNG|nr:hypothetical protein BDK51DRAFT_41225 [Blyttiomyces helicus]|eukprot:RKO94803.1 hypothetical protein BDK51DRAFT_41225 [Blyttiomyces helicus]
MPAPYGYMGIVTEGAKVLYHPRDDITSEALQRLLRAHGSNLKLLDLTGSSCVDDDVLACIGQSAPHLEFLDLGLYRRESALGRALTLDDVAFIAALKQRCSHIRQIDLGLLSQPTEEAHRFVAEIVVDIASRLPWTSLVIQWINALRCLIHASAPPSPHVQSQPNTIQAWIKSISQVPLPDPVWALGHRHFPGMGGDSGEMQPCRWYKVAPVDRPKGCPISFAVHFCVAPLPLSFNGHFSCHPSIAIMVIMEASATEYHDQMNFELDLDPLASPTLTPQPDSPTSAGFEFLYDGQDLPTDALTDDEQSQRASSSPSLDLTNIDFSYLLDDIPSLQDANSGEDAAAAAACGLQQLFGDSASAHAPLDGTMEAHADWAQQLAVVVSFI